MTVAQSVPWQWTGCSVPPPPAHHTLTAVVTKCTFGVPGTVTCASQAFSVEESGPCRALTANGDPIPFETALFKGVVAVYIRHLPTTPSHLFKGKKRLAWVALQVSRERQQVN